MVRAGKVEKRQKAAKVGAAGSSSSDKQLGVDRLMAQFVQSWLSYYYTFYSLLFFTIKVVWAIHTCILPNYIGCTLYMSPYHHHSLRLLAPLKNTVTLCLSSLIIPILYWLMLLLFVLRKNSKVLIKLNIMYNFSCGHVGTGCARPGPSRAARGGAHAALGVRRRVSFLILIIFACMYDWKIIYWSHLATYFSIQQLLGALDMPGAVRDRQLLRGIAPWLVHRIIVRLLNFFIDSCTYFHSFVHFYMHLYG